MYNAYNTNLFCLWYITVYIWCWKYNQNFRPTTFVWNYFKPCSEETSVAGLKYWRISAQHIGPTYWPNILAQHIDPTYIGPTYIGPTYWPNILAQRIGLTYWHNILAQHIGARVNVALLTYYRAITGFGLRPLLLLSLLRTYVFLNTF